MKKRLLSILLTLCMVLCLVPTAARADASDTNITGIDLKGLSSELWSYKDMTFATVDDDANYTIKEQAWNATDGTSIKPDSASLKPKAGMEYTFIITLEAKDGYVFPIKSETNVFYDGTVKLDGTEYTDGATSTVSSDGKTLKVTLFMLTKAKGVTLPEVDVSTEDGLAAALSDTSIDMIRLISDIDLTAWNSSTTGGFYVHLAITRKVTIDLNGYVLKGTGANSRTGVFEVTDGGDLTIIDSRPTAPHKFTDNDGLWVLDEQNGDKAVNGGIITGGRTNGGGGVEVCEGGRLTLSGGSIVGCLSENVNGSGGGGGVYIRNNGTFTMSGGGIIGCVAQDSGGAVFFYKRGTFTMTGGVVQNCTANGDGGDALFLYGGTMNAGGGMVDGTVVVDVAYDSASYSYIPGVIQGAQGSTDATLFNGDVTNYGEIKCGTFSGTVTLGNSTLSGTISGGTFNGPVTTASKGEAEIGGGVFNNTVTIDRGRITNGIFNKDVVVDNVQVSFSCTTLTDGTYNGLIINKSAYAAFAGAHSPLGIVGTKPSSRYSNDRYRTVTFDLAGGEMDYPVRYFFDDGNISDQIVPDPRTGYFFAGWYNGENKWNYSDSVGEDDLTLTARWTACDHSGHTGAQPTCTTSVICTACGGTIDALGHDLSVQEHDEDTHWEKCSRCDATGGKEPHDWNAGTVTKPASCTTSGEKTYTCTGCGLKKIETIGAKGHSYDKAWQHDATHHWHACSNCDEKLDREQHTGGTASCKDKAVCAVCGESYGDLGPDEHAPDGRQEWTKTATAHEQKWTCCGAVTVASEDHAWADGVCTECGYACLHDDANNDHVCDICKKTISDHTGGKATCKGKAVCAVCHESYGDLDPDEHTDLTHVEAKAATKDAEGNSEYWYCGGCGKYFSDAAATKEIDKAATVTAKLPNEPQAPQTGDNSAVALWIALLFIGGASIGAAAVGKKKKHNSQQTV